MYDYNKPDLFIHPFYHHIIKTNFDLDCAFNVCSLDDLEGEQIAVTLLTDQAAEPIDVMLDPYYTDTLIKESGSNPFATSYWFAENTPLYRLRNTSPRYVIWTPDHNLTLCGTRVDRVHSYQLYRAVQRAKDWAYAITAARSIVVFDLDDTLVDANGVALDGSHEVLRVARRLYDYMVIWSHGSSLHVDECLTQFDESFDLVLRRDGNPINKNLLHLYNYIPNCRFTRALLVDDSVYNWTPEYSEMLVPARGIKSLRRALPMLH